MDSNKTYRIRTDVGNDKVLNIKLDQNYNMFEILSLKLTQENFYKQHKSNYGIVVGRVHTKNFGIPNAKVSVFIQVSDIDINDPIKAGLYPFNTTQSKNRDGVRYNLLPDEEVSDCHQIIGTFPNKRYVLDNDIILEIYDTYYKYTTRTNNSGDYMLPMVPVGNHTIHVDIDVSDIGILSQRPRDLVYKGYNITQFENANQFKIDTNLDSLSQVYSQDSMVYVYPFWGDTEEGDIAISRSDIEMQYKFEPTCVFMGSIVTDKATNAIGKKCIATEKCGAMDELIPSAGNIEMIRYRPDGVIEEATVQGTKLIDGNGVWCYQIPMNLDYVMTDEYGNFVPTNDPDKGIATRARVRFRISVEDTGDSAPNVWRAKMLVPNNPVFRTHQLATDDTSGIRKDSLDYEFGTLTDENSFRDLLWNKVYTVKSYIPRIQKGNSDLNKRFTGIKHTNIHGANNPIPYNNIRIQMPFMFSVMCVIIKFIIKFTQFYNKFMGWFMNRIAKVGDIMVGVGLLKNSGRRLLQASANFRCVVLPEGFCQEMDGWYYAPGCHNAAVIRGECKDEFEPNCNQYLTRTLWSITGRKITNLDSDNGSIWGWITGIFTGSIIAGAVVDNLTGSGVSTGVSGEGLNELDVADPHSIEEKNREDMGVCLTGKIDYLMQCVEIQLAQEYQVINFDFYNDWLNGVLYLPQWLRHIRPKKRFLFGLFKRKAKVQACMTYETRYRRRLAQQCALQYELGDNGPKIVSPKGCVPFSDNAKILERCHKKLGRRGKFVFGKQGGVINEDENMLGQNIYYYKPMEWDNNGNDRRILFATDLVLLGSLNDCDIHGIPQVFRYLSGTTYQIPTNLALTNMDDVGYIYAIKPGKYTVCDVGEDPTEADDEGYDTKIDGEILTMNPVLYHQALNASTSYIAKNSGYTGNPVYEEDINRLDDGDNDEGIPLTEMSGIDWGYLGPGQVDNDYYAGGHFLGIACTNSQTNIKSCVNLTRACEVGVWLDQRQEYPTKFNDDTDQTETIDSSTTILPDGIISRDELNGSDVRAMFATLNHNNLRVIDDKENGLKKYDLSYHYPTNFDGSFTQINTHIDTNEPKFGIERKMEGYDSNYYNFRMGVGTTNITPRYYYRTQNGTLGMFPVFENSFYFYFGIKEGSTAFDEFNKQFFAPCKRNKINNILVVPEVVPGELCADEGDSSVTLTAHNAETPITFNLYNSSGAEITLGKEIISDNIVKFDNLNFGSYSYTVTDGLQNTYTNNFTIGGQTIEINKRSVVNFTVSTENLGATDIAQLRSMVWGSYPGTGTTIGGYVAIDNITLGPESDLDDNELFYILAKKSGVGGEYENYNVSDDYVDVASLDGLPIELINSYKLLGVGTPWAHAVGSPRTIAFWGEGVYELYVYQTCGDTIKDIRGLPTKVTFNVEEPEAFELYFKDTKLNSQLFKNFNTGFENGTTLSGWNHLSDINSYVWNWTTRNLYPDERTKEAVIYMLKKFVYLDTDGLDVKFDISGENKMNKKVQTFFESENEDGTLSPPTVFETTGTGYAVADVMKPTLVSTDYIVNPTITTNNDGIFKWSVKRNDNMWPGLKPPYYAMAYEDLMVIPDGAEKVEGLNNGSGNTVPELLNWFGVHILDKPFHVDNTMIWKSGKYYSYNSLKTYVPITSLPNGYSLAGKTIRFTETSWATDVTRFFDASQRGGYVNEEIGSSDGTWLINKYGAFQAPTSEGDGTTPVYCGVYLLLNGVNEQLYYGNDELGIDGWVNTLEFTFPNDPRYIINYRMTSGASDDPQTWSLKYVMVELATSEGEIAEAIFDGKVKGVVHNGVAVRNRYATPVDAFGRFEIGDCGIVVGEGETFPMTEGTYYQYNETNQTWLKTGSQTTVKASVAQLSDLQWLTGLVNGDVVRVLSDLSTDNSRYALFNADTPSGGIEYEDIIKTERQLDLKGNGHKIPMSADGTYTVLFSEANPPISGYGQPNVITRNFITPNLTNGIVRLVNDCESNNTHTMRININGSYENNTKFYLISNNTIVHPYFGTNDGESPLFNLTDMSGTIEVDPYGFSLAITPATGDIFYLVSTTTSNIVVGEETIEDTGIKIASFSNIYDFSELSASVSGSVINFTGTNWYLSTLPCQVLIQHRDGTSSNMNVTKLLTNGVGSVTVMSDVNSVSVIDALNIEHICRLS